MANELIAKPKEAEVVEKPHKVKKLRVDSLSDEYRKGLGRLLELNPKQIDKIKDKIKEEISTWLNDCADLHKKLEDWNDLVEGVVEQDEPFEGAHQSHIDIVGVYLKVYHSIERRSILGAENIWYSETDPESEDISDFTSSIEQMLNYKVRNDWNIEDGLSDAFYCAGRDGLSGLKIPQVEDYETVNDIVYVENKEQLLDEFPDAESSGMTEQEYDDLVSMVEREAGEETPVEIPITYEKPLYIGPKAYLIERVNFVIFPAQAKNLENENCRGYGDRFTLRKGKIQEKLENKIWYKEETEGLLKAIKKGSKGNSYRMAQESIVGISRSDNTDDHELYEIVYRMELEKGKGEKKLLLVYSYEHDKLVSCQAYPYRIDFYVPFRVEKRPNQMDGRSIVEQLEGPSEEIDLMHSQRVQSRQITNVPSFKAKKSAKKDFDPEAEENEWGPGVIFWLEDPDSFQQFKVQPVDLGESMQEENNLFKFTSLQLGVDAWTFSGRPSPEDPNAPGVKTAMLIDQSNMRMDDVLVELRRGVEKVGEICLSHLYQFGPGEISYQSQEEGKYVSKTIPKRILRKGIRLKMQGITVTMNADSEFRRWMGIYGALIQDPMIAQNDEGRHEMLRRALVNGRIQGRDRILPTLQKLQQTLIDRQKQAIIQMQMEKRMKEQEANQQAMRQKLDMGKAMLDKKKMQQKQNEKVLRQMEKSRVKKKI